MKFAGFIRVEDASGARFRIFEYRLRRLLREVSVFLLDTGEPVSPDGAGNYVVTRTGETLCVVEEDLDVIPEAQGSWFEAILSR
jgi:hypothetical protein